MPKQSSKPPSDTNALAAFIVQTTTAQAESAANDGPEKNPAAVALGRLGGLKGGRARAQALSKQAVTIVRLGQRRFDFLCAFIVDHHFTVASPCPSCWIICPP